MRIALNLPFNPKNVLHVVANLVCQHIGLGELARRSESSLQFVIKGEIDVDLFIFGAIKRSGGGLRAAAPGLCVIAEENEFRVVILLAGLCRQNLRPVVLRVVENERDELNERLLRCVLCRIRTTRCYWSGTDRQRSSKCKEIGSEKSG